MVTKEDIESFLDRIDSGTANVSEPKPATWVVKTVAGAEVVVFYAPPVVILRVTVMNLPASEPRRSELLRELLALNTLELENLDFNEFEASFDSITLALASHLGALAPYRE